MIIVGVLRGNRYSILTRRHIVFIVSDGMMVNLKKNWHQKLLELDFADTCVS